MPPPLLNALGSWGREYQVGKKPGIHEQEGDGIKRGTPKRRHLERGGQSNFDPKAHFWYFNHFFWRAGAVLTFEGLLGPVWSFEAL